MVEISHSPTSPLELLERTALLTFPVGDRSAPHERKSAGFRKAIHRTGTATNFTRLLQRDAAPALRG